MPSLLSLPQELIPYIVSYLDRASVKSLRQTCRTVVQATTAELFRTVSLFPDDRSCDRLDSLLADPDMCKLPRKIYIYTIEKDNEPDEADHLGEAVYPRRWKDLLPRVNSFGNVESAVLRFDQCYSAEAEDWHPFYPQTAGFRFQAIDDFFSMLASLKLPVKELGLWNLQVDNPRNQETLKKLRGVLSGLRSLRLTVVCEHSGAAPEDDIERPEPHRFFRELPTTWLVPAASSLRHLSLVDREYFGFYPKLDLSGVHLPHLESLSLGNFTFAYDSQIDWIVSHAASLRDLYLDDCPILYDVAMYEEHLDACGLSLGETEFRRDDSQYGSRKCFRAWDRRWHHIFATFESKLSQLRNLYMGSSGWCGLAPFEKEDEIQVALFSNRYMACYDGYGPSIYMTDGDISEDYERKAPSCNEEDRDALRSLLRKLGQPVKESYSLTRRGYNSGTVKGLICDGDTW